jgi:hypothetical protein
LLISDIRYGPSLVRYWMKICLTEGILVRYQINPIPTELNPISVNPISDTVEDVCAPSKSITANDLPAGVAVRAFASHAEGPGSNPAQDKNFHWWLECLCRIECKAFYSGDPNVIPGTLVNSLISSVLLVALLAA